MRRLILLLGTLAAGLALAAEVPRRSIPIEYVSPGASGSVSSSSTSQRYDRYGGHEGHGGRVQIIKGGASVQQRGGIRRSIEYPGGLELELQPGQSGHQSRRRR